jgi:DNA ligase OB-like domain
MKLQYEKPKKYEGGDLDGDWDVTFKIDGVRAFITPQGVFSRNGKPLYNLDYLKGTTFTDVEVYCGSWEKTISAVKTQWPVDYQPVDIKHIYSLDPLDQRLFYKTVTNPTELEIKLSLRRAQTIGGYEGLVLRQTRYGKQTWLKVKGEETHDVKITGVIEGEGKYKGMLGAFLTAKGKVGSGFTDEDRRVLYDLTLVGSMVEVECQKLTPLGMFRHPRFKRMRFDK